MHLQYDSSNQCFTVQIADNETISSISSGSRSNHLRKSFLQSTLSNWKSLWAKTCRLGSTSRKSRAIDSPWMPDKSLCFKKSKIHFYVDIYLFSLELHFTESWIPENNSYHRLLFYKADLLCTVSECYHTVEDMSSMLPHQIPLNGLNFWIAAWEFYSINSLESGNSGIMVNDKTSPFTLWISMCCTC